MKILEVLEHLGKRKEFEESILSHHGDKLEHVTIFFEQVLEETFDPDDDYYDKERIAQDILSECNIDNNIYDELVDTYFNKYQKEDLKSL